MTNTKMTPREPTPEMVEAGMRSDENHRPDYAAIWRAMWDAAPVVDRWQPIASAPNEGTPVMVWCADRGDMRVASVMSHRPEGRGFSVKQD